MQEGKCPKKIYKDDQAERWLLEKYPVTTIDGPLYSRALGLRFQVNKTHFKHDDRLHLKCVAKIADLPQWETEITVKQNYQRYTNEKPAPDRFRNNLDELKLFRGDLDQFGASSTRIALRYWINAAAIVSPIRKLLAMLEAANALEPIERRYWMHPFNEKREEEEEKLQFYTSIQLIRVGITKKNTFMRNGICAEERFTIQFCNTCPAIPRQALSL
ncbi:hypothetical protein PGB90_008892 [Kerria lacca]